MAERLQKLLAAAGLCSRRMAEEWISAGRVCVNGAPATLGEIPSPWTASRCPPTRGGST